MENPQYFVFNENRALLDQPRTIICTGMGRSGTSAVMSLLEFLGVWVGGERSGNRENKELKRALDESTLAAQKVIARYNRHQRVWGFKAPSLRKDLAETLQMFRNPMLIVPHRDPVGKLGRQMASERKSITLDDIHRLIVSHRRLVEELQKVDAPQLHIAFPLLSATPDQALRCIGEFVGIAVPEGDVRLHMKRYRNRYLAKAASSARRSAAVAYSVAAS